MELLTGPAKRQRPSAVWLLLLIPVGLVAAGQWARRSNAERDAGITWLWAYSPRTMQTYQVRATVDGEAIEFRLEDGKPYQFRNCKPGDGEENSDSCRDQSDLSWDIYR